MYPKWRDTSNSTVSKSVITFILLSQSIQSRKAVAVTLLWLVTSPDNSVYINDGKVLNVFENIVGRVLEMLCLPFDGRGWESALVLDMK